MEIRSQPPKEAEAYGKIHAPFPLASSTSFTLYFRLKIGGNHALDVVEEELLGMGKGGKKLKYDL